MTQNKKSEDRKKDIDRQMKALERYRESTLTRRGSKTKINQHIQKTICDAIRVGSYIETAVSYAGLSKSAFHHWMQRAHKELERREIIDDIREMEHEESTEQYGVKLSADEIERRLKRDVEDDLIRKREEPFVVFADAIEKAKADAEMSDLNNISKTARGGLLISKTTVENPDGTVETQEKYSSPQWTASAWKLERRNPSRWGRRQLELTGEMNGSVEVKHSWVDMMKDVFSEDNQKKLESKTASAASEEKVLTIDVDEGEDS